MRNLIWREVSSYITMYAQMGLAILISCIPMLKREDIKKEAAHLTNEELDLEGSLFLYHDVCTNGIGYLDLLFEVGTLTREETHYLGLLKSVLGYVDTEHYTYGALFNEINANTGGIYSGVALSGTFEIGSRICRYRTLYLRSAV